MAKKRMYYYDLTEPGYPRITKEWAEGYCSLFLRAPSKKAIKETGIRFIDGKCANNTPFREIQLGKKYHFRADKQVEFIGTPVEVVEIDGIDHLKILIGDKGEVELYTCGGGNSHSWFRIQIIG